MLDIYPGIHYERFDKRLGKVHIINELEKMANSEILVFTDVHAFIDKGALVNLAKHFLNPDIKVVGGRLKNAKSSLEGIVYQENVFLQQEFKLKYAEGKLLGTMIGAYGAFYAIRKSAFQDVPENYIADDFYISIKAIQNGGMAICEPDAVAYENVSGYMQSEFNRKARISVGNFQNLSALYSILFSKKIGLSFCFFSHKVLRWLGPLFIIIMIISSFFIWFKNIFYTIFFIIMMLSFIAPLIDYFTRKIQIHIIILRFIAHFYYMNLALLFGLFKFMKGVKTNVWEPTNRE
jgi:cellulose synthase/poly-beta-1,6-N-acetylglucosamine synthase-like glycosyltransferase